MTFQECHIGTMKLKGSDGQMKEFGKSVLTDPQYVSTDWQGKKIPVMKGTDGKPTTINSEGWRYLTFKPVPWFGTETVNDKHQLLTAISDLYDEFEAYNDADLVESPSGAMRAEKAVQRISDNGANLAQTILNKAAYGIGLLFKNELFRKPMLKQAEQDLRSEHSLGDPPAAKRQVKAPVEMAEEQESL